MKFGIIEKYDKPFEYIGAFMNLMLAYQFYNLWTNPQSTDIHKIGDFAVLIAFEFIMVHSGVFMSIMPKKWSLYFFIPFYGLFALVMNSSVSDNSILIIYCLVVFNRMRFAFTNVSPKLRARSIAMSIFSALIYFILVVGLTVSYEHLPNFGLTTSFLNSINYYETINTSGVFTDHPHVPICIGLIYYTLLTLIEISIIDKDFRPSKTSNQ